MINVTSIRRFRLLPPDEYIGWTPFAWLIYLPTFLIEPLVRQQAGKLTVAYATLTLLGFGIFLTSYFRGYWVRGRELLAVIAIQTALGALFAPINTGSSVFFIYAATFNAQVEPPRVAIRIVALITAIGALTAWAAHAPPVFWIVATVLTPILGGVSVHFAEVGRATKRLQLARDEIGRLAVVAERERIARDLHDVLGHTLSLIVLKAELAAKLAERDPRRAAKEMRDVEQVSRKALQEVRDTIRGYRAMIDDEVARARSLLAAAGIRADFAVAAPRGLERAREEALALALREAVTNVVRHSGASVCAVRLAPASDAWTLEVEDDGRGGSASDGTGLRGMRERVEALGGAVTVDAEHTIGANGGSQRGGGTRLIVSIPAPLSADAVANPS
jgi:two-component system sensor histidine kinase DesK